MTSSVVNSSTWHHPFHPSPLATSTSLHYIHSNSHTHIHSSTELPFTTKMHFLTTLVALAAAVSTTLAAATPAIEARADPIFYCGTQPYKKTDYTCFPQNGNALCPIQSGVALQPCGSGSTLACYDPSNYGCANGKLYLIQKCGGIPYDTNTYVCVGGHLCPKTDPLRCGNACYNSSKYKCVNGVLTQV